jgi:hypothetical protein
MLRVAGCLTESMSRRNRITAYASAGLLVVAGATCAAVVVTEAGEILAFTLVGLGLIALTGLMFFEAGLSEDRERERERRRSEQLEHSERLKHPEQLNHPEQPRRRLDRFRPRRGDIRRTRCRTVAARGEIVAARLSPTSAAPSAPLGVARSRDPRS